MLWILLGIGFVLIFEGLVLALAPRVYDQVLEMIAQITPEQRRSIGLVAIAVGVLLIWLAKALGLPVTAN